MERYDAIVIGSGIGGMTTAALMAHVGGKRVLVLEKHWVVGGLTHVFKRRGGFEWDVGIHYIGQMERNNLPQRLLDTIAGDRLKWTRMPESFERFCYPDYTFEVPRGADAYAASLHERFPREGDNIAGYFEDIKRAVAQLGAHVALGACPTRYRERGRAMHAPFARLIRTTTKDYLDRRFESDALKMLLCSQWGNVGLPPSQSAFGIHAVVVWHYLDGGYYPVGGAKSIARSILPTIEAAGGAVRTRRRVVEVITRGGRAIGVRAERVHKGSPIEEVYHADVVVSSVGAANTFAHLVEHEATAPLEEEITQLGQGTSGVSVYLGLDTDPSALGVSGENYWLFAQTDHDRIFETSHRALSGDPQMVYLSFPSLKDPKAKRHTALAMTLLPDDAFARWVGADWLNRGEDYDALKRRIADGMLDLIEVHIPGLRAHITHIEVASPLTYTDFTSWPRGGFYGLPFTPQRLDLRWLGVYTPIDGLLLGGSDAVAMGMYGALMGGFIAAVAALGGGSALPRVLGKIMTSARPSDRIWSGVSKHDDDARRWRS